ncbi:glutaminyl-peptide cyclotransferase [Thiohalocapsa sp.]|uniref:glutaminyl-peptide cyclotransferase n=1 Tax=Thiohalocapsa sp. TaxID=2497641 RepID=UPI00345B582E
MVSSAMCPMRHARHAGSRRADRVKVKARAQGSEPVRFSLFCFICTLLVAIGGASVAALPPPVHGFRVIANWPHDPRAFTQGLVVVDGTLYESTGGYGASSLRRVDLTTGRVIQQRALPDRLFGEGLTVWGGELVQLTWRAGRVLRYERSTFSPLSELPLAGEGWGLTHDGTHWIVSDGSAALRFLDPVSGAEVRRVEARDGAQVVSRLNELELVPVPVKPVMAGAEPNEVVSTREEIWANIWHQDRLVRIDPADGRVLGYVDLTGLWPRSERPHREAVLNGIAYDSKQSRLLVTGKHWPRLYWIAVPGLLPAPEDGAN